MHRWMAFTVGLGILLISAGAAWAQAERPSPNMLVLSAPRGERAAPTIIRGTPAERAAARPAAAPEGDRWQIVGGKRLWLVDRETGEVRGCINQDTFTVGVRVIRCTSGELGRYGRTFGPDFQP
jgi:hypothetical protein